MARLIFLDVESTGTDPYTDRIVEITMRTEAELLLSCLVNPGVPIPAEATKVHGITDADVADATTFEAIAPHVQDIIEDAVLVGYNIRRFDTIIVDVDLRRAGGPGLPHDSADRIIAQEIDLFQIWKRFEERNLASAARRFAGMDLGEEAHSSDADTAVLPAIYEGMASAFNFDTENVGLLCAMSVPEGSIDRDARFVKLDNGAVVFNFGQHKGESVYQHPDFLEWMLKKDFSPETKNIARVLWQRTQKQMALL